MERYDEKTKTAADRLELLAELRLEFIELTPSGQNNLNESTFLNLQQAKKLEHSKQKASVNLSTEWLSMSQNDRKNVATILEARSKENRSYEPSARKIFDHAGNVTGIEFDCPPGSGCNTKLELKDNGNSVSLTVHEGPQAVDFLLKLLGQKSNNSHSYQEAQITKN